MQPDNPLILRVDAEHPDRDAVAKAVKALRQGALVILPTDTVYGVAADPRVPGAVERLCAAKGRDADKPIPFLLDRLGRAERLKAKPGKLGRRLARRFWPGPLTLVLPTGKGFEGFRVPDHRVTLAVLRASGTALRVTSANRSGEAPARCVEEAVAALGSSVAVALDSGPAPLGEASAVVKVDGREVSLIREGAIPWGQIRDAIRDRLLLFVCSGNLCRSPMAEYLMRNWLGADSEWAVGSAGVSASNGQPASPEAVEVLKELGVDLRPHRSRALTRELVDAASLVVVMTASHRSAVLERFAEAHGKVVLLKSVAASSSGSGDVADPIGASAETYRGVRDEINAVLPDLVLYVHDIAGGQSRRKKGAR